AGMAFRRMISIFVCTRPTVSLSSRRVSAYSLVSFSMACRDISGLLGLGNLVVHVAAVAARAVEQELALAVDGDRPADVVTDRVVGGGHALEAPAARDGDEPPADPAGVEELVEH